MGKDRRLFKTFLFHLRPQTIREPALRFTYTWGLGGSSALLVLLLMGTGVMLKLAYSPIPHQAYDSIVAFQAANTFGRFIRNVHHWSAHLLVIFVFLHLLRVFFTGAYTDRRKINWWVGMTISAVVLLSNFTGYLLPWDQLAFWAVTICTSMLIYIPIVGDQLQQMIIGGRELGPGSLANFYALHTAVLPAVLLLAMTFHFWRIRKAGGLAARAEIQIEENVPGRRIETLPHLLVRELAMAASVTALVMMMAALWDAPLGPRANPGLSPNPTKAPWYFAGLQEMLLHLHPILGVAVIPLLVTTALALVPFFSAHHQNCGLWFGGPRGRRMVWMAALLASIVTPMWIIGYANGLKFLTWLAPVLGLSLMSGIYGITRKIMGDSIHDGIQATFTFALIVFILMTMTGIWFRGSNMALKWPWQ